jgi:hypothetical protein
MRGSVPSGKTIRLGWRWSLSIKLPIKRIAVLYRMTKQTATDNHARVAPFWRMVARCKVVHL